MKLLPWWLFPLTMAALCLVFMRRAVWAIRHFSSEGHPVAVSEEARLRKAGRGERFTHGKPLNGRVSAACARREHQRCYSLTCGCGCHQ